MTAQRKSRGDHTREQSPGAENLNGALGQMLTTADLLSRDGGGPQRRGAARLGGTQGAWRQPRGPASGALPHCLSRRGRRGDAARLRKLGCAPSDSAVRRAERATKTKPLPTQGHCPRERTTGLCSQRDSQTRRCLASRASLPGLTRQSSAATADSSALHTTLRSAGYMSDQISRAGIRMSHGRLLPGASRRQPASSHSWSCGPEPPQS